jgi:hypothetical protein
MLKRGNIRKPLPQMVNRDFSRDAENVNAPDRVRIGRAIDPAADGPKFAALLPPHLRAKIGAAWIASARLR